MKVGIALAGGGSKGSYEVGAWKALRELGVSFDIVTGTSIGAVNGALMVQGDYDKAVRLWQTATAETIMNHGLNLTHDMDDYFDNREQLIAFAKDYAASRGADISPYRARLDAELDEDAFFASPIDFALVTARFPTMQMAELRKADMRRGSLSQWILASSSCFPVFPLCEIDGQSYIDGGYADNLPIGAAFRLGAERVIAVALKQDAFSKKYGNHPLVTRIIPSRPLGPFLDFERSILDRNFTLGYVDTMRVMGRYFGRTYALRPEGREALLAAAERYLLWLLRRELAPAESAVAAVLDRVRGETPLTERLLDGRSGDLCDCACAAVDALMETLGYAHERVYDVPALLEELRAALRSEETPALEGARELCAVLRRERWTAQLQQRVPTHSAQEVLFATWMLYLEREDA